jgi:hypothetical protein
VPWSTDRWLAHQVTNFLFPLDGGAIGIVRVMSARKGGNERERDRNKQEKGDRMVRALQVKHLWTGLPPPPLFLAAATTISPVCVIRAGCSAFRLIPSWVVPWATQQLLLLAFYLYIPPSINFLVFGLVWRFYPCLLVCVTFFFKHSSEAVRSFSCFSFLTKRPDTRGENKKFSSFECRREQSNLQDVNAF